ncbi:unnamed protein product [Closterium sp. NIES-64]|nr:unnamed protein product [Closterium sp. NIES-64]CAI5939792.1 unnamed protein product [Closterium sp. NIES-64]CAI5995291.1 unnamed protein product [Closterium sp. NIES-65]
MIFNRAATQQQPTNAANDLATAPSEAAFQLRGSASDEGSVVGDTRAASGEGSEAIKDLSGPPVLCWERVGGSTKAYVANEIGGGGDGTEGAGRGRKGRRRKPFFIQDVGERADAVMELTDFFKTNFLPEGFPDSVAPSFVPYMRWRALQYFFGGAMGVFTTRSLLHALGVSRGAGGGGAAASALAVNWVLKDGAGRLGKMLFARHGKRFDCDLKQMRFLSNMLLDFGCCVELCTMAAPKFFLPLACVANVFKNIGAVTNTSTRAPIYKAFARRENIGDITAKGESISNLADLMGTGAGILIARSNPHLAATFALLSCGYLFASFNEVKSVQVPTLNRARFAVAVRSFLETGQVPSLAEANARERILVLPWAVDRPLELGARVADAFRSPSDLLASQAIFKDEQYIVTYLPSHRRAYVVLKEGAKSRDVVRAAFQTHVLLHLLHQWRQDTCQQPLLTHHLSPGNSPKVQTPGSFNPAALSPTDLAPTALSPTALTSSSPGRWAPKEISPKGPRAWQRSLTSAEVERAVSESLELTRTLFGTFEERAAAEGWTMADSLLNPGKARVLSGPPTARIVQAAAVPSAPAAAGSVAGGRVASTDGSAGLTLPPLSASGRVALKPFAGAAA